MEEDPCNLKGPKLQLQTQSSIARGKTLELFARPDLASSKQSQSVSVFQLPLLDSNDSWRDPKNDQESLATGTLKKFRKGYYLV